MTTPIIIGSVVTYKFVQLALLGMVLNKGTSVFKKKEVIESWSVTQFLEESKYVKR
jgi:hypothetical protein